MKPTYKEIVKATTFGPIRSRQISEYICMALSPFFSRYFIHFHIRPNTITIFMIISGVLGAIFFAAPNIICKIIGILLLFLWFIMDSSDGEVARYTKTFSRYGKEMDYLAHIIDHPCVNLAMWLTYVQIGTYNIYIISALFITFISTELITRNLILIEVYDKNKNEKSSTIFNPSWAKWLFLQLVYYPNIVLFLPIIILGDFVGLYNSLYILAIIFVANLLNTANMYRKTLKKCYKTL
ncbi:CDP-alcohol phosphatidyltransferase family protein [Segatella sp.]